MSSDIDQDQSAEEADVEDDEVSGHSPDGGLRKKSKRRRKKNKDIEKSSGDSDSQTVNDDGHDDLRLRMMTQGKGDQSQSGIDADSEGQASQSAHECKALSPAKPFIGAQDGISQNLDDEDGKIQSLPLLELQKIQKAIELLSTQQQIAPKNIEEATRKTYKFWETQPVPKFDEKITANQEIELDKPVDEIRKEPYSLPQGFLWDTLDITDPLVLKELYTLLNENYVEDDDNMFRFDYSPEFLQWALQPPGWLRDWHCGVRVSKSQKLVGFISAVPAHIKIYSREKKMVEINFLCVHKKLRSKRVAPVLIREITRRVHLKGLFQAVYTAGVVLPKPVACCRYWHRSLNPRKLIEVKFSHLSRNMTMQRTLKLYKLPDTPKAGGFRPLTAIDVPEAFDLMNRHMRRFDLAPVFTEEEFRHWFLARPGIIDSFVVETNGELTDFVSFYTLPSTVMHHPVHKNLKAAYSFYNVSTRTSWVDLMQDALIIAKNMGFDVFNALDLMENKDYLEKLKFGIGDGNLQYYLYNWKCPAMEPKQVGLVLQ